MAEFGKSLIDPDQTRKDKRSALLTIPQYRHGPSGERVPAYCSEILIPLRLAANSSPASTP
jgi:hypothetical protein